MLIQDSTYRYDPGWVARKYDAYGEKEWERFSSSPLHELQFAVHQHHLQEHIHDGMRVLEVGAGAGRFTQSLVNLGARVTVLDLSSRQLELNKQNADRFGFDHGIERWILGDMCEMLMVESETFEAVVCFGGPLSYVFERRDTALREMRRTLVPYGTLLLSVMSLWGSCHEFLPGVLELDPKVNQTITSAGDLTPNTNPEGNHWCHMFRAAELRKLLERTGYSVISMSASSCLGSAWGDRLCEFRRQDSQWNELVRMEIEACREEGCIDMGTHLIGVARKRRFA